jgi:UDP-3-O-[3-hydroxymyristoyl] glucosamine N-acyltransferase
MQERRIKLSELADQYGLRYHGDGDTVIDGVGTLSEATGSQLSFLSNPSYRPQLADTKAAVVLVKSIDVENCPVNALVADDPYVTYALLATLFDHRRSPTAGVHASASIDEAAKIGKNVHVGAQAVIGAGCEIADGCIIGPGCVLVADCKMGENSRLIANVTLCDGVSLGKRCTIHPGAVIGADGFGMAFDRDHWVKIPQLGSVVIGNDCEIGANTTIDRGAIGDTVIEDDVRLDNQIQIGHNVHIGAHTAMAGQVGISGSTRIGQYCMFAGSSGAVGHLQIADRTTVNFRSVITRSIEEPGTVWSAALGAQPMREWNRTVVHLRKLEKLARRVLNLEKSVNKEPKIGKTTGKNQDNDRI